MTRPNTVLAMRRMNVTFGNAMTINVGNFTWAQFETTARHAVLRSSPKVTAGRIQALSVIANSESMPVSF
jgi:hypothetical protein